LLSSLHVFSKTKQNPIKIWRFLGEFSEIAGFSQKRLLRPKLRS
jgi:hypothetical protein